MDISKVANMLIRKNNEAVSNNKRLYDQDRRLLTSIQSTLFKELATALDTSTEEISETVTNMVHQHE
ncbi:hypothetical protein [Oceanobacillus saliphilus]|uniref:hypothetical protein n=1 Tax=Oceanobacillus saliphilus TaxID=2925834 RepID=UPI0034D5D33E